MADLKRARIQDVAEQAGVSMMTVSRVLNQDKKVSDKTRQKVMAVVEQLNYRPNVSARRLASTKSFFLGLLYDNPSDSYISQFLLAALKKCRALGYHLVVDEAHSDIDKTIESVKQLIDVTQVDGMILLPPMCDNEQVLDVLTKAQVPFVRITPDTKLNRSWRRMAAAIFVKPLDGKVSGIYDLDMTEVNKALTKWNEARDEKINVMHFV